MLIEYVGCNDSSNEDGGKIKVLLFEPKTPKLRTIPKPLAWKLEAQREKIFTKLKNLMEEGELLWPVVQRFVTLLGFMPEPKHLVVKNVTRLPRILSQESEDPEDVAWYQTQLGEDGSIVVYMLKGDDIYSLKSEKYSSKVARGQNLLSTLQAATALKVQGAKLRAQVKLSQSDTAAPKYAQVESNMLAQAKAAMESCAQVAETDTVETAAAHEAACQEQVKYLEEVENAQKRSEHLANAQEHTKTVKKLEAAHKRNHRMMSVFNKLLVIHSPVRAGAQPHKRPPTTTYVSSSTSHIPKPAYAQGLSGGPFSPAYHITLPAQPSAHSCASRQPPTYSYPRSSSAVDTPYRHTSKNIKIIRGPLGPPHPITSP